MSTTVADADAIIAACAERGLALGVGYQQRYRNVPRATYEQIRSGAIGKVHAIQFSQTFQMFVDPAFGGDWSWWANPRASATSWPTASTGSTCAAGWPGDGGVGIRATRARFRARPREPENTTMGLLTFDNGTIMSLWASSA